MIVKTPIKHVQAVHRAQFCTSLCLCSGAAAENMLGSLLCLPGSGSVLLDPYGSTISETTSEAWSVEVLPSDSGGKLDSFSRCNILLLQTACSQSVVSVIVLIHALHLHDSHKCVCCVHMCGCMRLDVCCVWLGLETPGVAALHSIPKMCAYICHHVYVHLPVFHGRSERASKRQLRVSSERPPGVCAPAVKQWGGKRKDSSCPQSVYMMSTLHMAIIIII